MRDIAVALTANTVLVHGDATMMSVEPVTVRTPPVAWGYAASVALVSLPQDNVLEVRLRVREASVGVGCASPDFATMLDEEVLEPSEAIQEVSLLSPPDGSGHVIIRSGSAPRPASVELIEVRSRPPTNEETVSPAAHIVAVADWNRFYGTRGESIREKRRVREYLRLDGPTTIEWTGGLRVLIRPNDQLSRALFVSGTYEPNTMLVLERLLPPGGVFLDVGAHVGLFTMFASRHVGRQGHVYSFEPSPRELQVLQQHIAMNGCESNVTVVDAAVGDSVGVASLSLAGGGASGLNTIGSHFAYDGVPLDRIVSVPMTTLDHVVDTLQADRVDVIKLDAEGSEYRCLLGAARLIGRDSPSLIIELFSRSLRTSGAAVDDVAQFLAAAGYRVFSIDAAAALHPLERLADADEQNVVALPREHPLARS